MLLQLIALMCMALVLMVVVKVLPTTATAPHGIQSRGFPKGPGKAGIEALILLSRCGSLSRWRDHRWWTCQNILSVQRVLRTVTDATSDSPCASAGPAERTGGRRYEELMTND